MHLLLMTQLDATISVLQSNRRLQNGDWISSKSWEKDKNPFDYQIEGIEHYITPATMKVFQSIIFIFKKHSELFKELEKYQNQRLYPENEDLGKLEHGCLGIVAIRYYSRLSKNYNVKG